MAHGDLRRAVLALFADGERHSKGDVVEILEAPARHRRSIENSVDALVRSGHLERLGGRPRQFVIVPGAILAPISEVQRRNAFLRRVPKKQETKSQPEPRPRPNGPPSAILRHRGFDALFADSREDGYASGLIARTCA